MNLIIFLTFVERLHTTFELITNYIPFFRFPTIGSLYPGHVYTPWGPQRC